MKTQDIIEQAKNYQYKIIDDFGKDPYNLRSHLPEAEKSALKLLKEFPEANKKIVLLAVWLHDTGHYMGDTDVDHAVKSEANAREFLKRKSSDELSEKVARVVRCHRCKDILPETLEEKIFACVDSASHMSDIVYVDILKSSRFEYANAKMDRDFRDVGLIPELKEELTSLHKAWKNLAKEYKKLKIVKESELYTDKV